jgi:hypothetical protein
MNLHLRWAQEEWLPILNVGKVCSVALTLFNFSLVICAIPLFDFGQSQRSVVVCPEPPTVTEYIVNGDAHLEAIRDEGKRGLH